MAAGDVLSQSEIDALLKQLQQSGGDAGEVIAPTPTITKEAVPYKFSEPTKFKKEQMRTLENIFENYARLVSSFLIGYLRTASHLEVASSEETSYREFSNSLLNPTILGIVEFLPLKGSVVIEMSSNIGYAIIDRVLGGPGVSLKKLRDFSEIEKILLERVITQLLGYLAEPWENVIRLKPKLEKVETNSQFAQIMSPNERVALIVLNIKIGIAEGYINFCLPHYLIKPIIEKLNTQYWFERPEVDDKEKYMERVEKELEKAEVPVSAVIGRTHVSVNDFVNLQVGDTIQLDSFVNSELQIMVGNLYKFRGKPGTSRGKIAFQITSLVDKEELYNG